MIEEEKVYSEIIDTYIKKDSYELIDLFSLIKLLNDNLTDNKTEFFIYLRDCVLDFCENYFKGGYITQNNYNKIKESLENVY